MSPTTFKPLLVTLLSLGLATAIPQAPYAENKPVAGEAKGRPPQVNSQGAMPVADKMGETYTSSFTYNYECTGPTMACGPNWNNDPSNSPGTLEPNLDHAEVGMAATNSWLYYNNWNGPNANLNKGWGGGCGQCWELTPKQEYNWHGIQPVSQLLPVGKPIIVTITDICTDGGTGDEQPGQLNGWGQEVHFDICRANNHVWSNFFGNGTNDSGNFPGQIIGHAKRVECPAKVPKFGSSCTDVAYKAKPDNCPPPGSGPAPSATPASDEQNYSPVSAASPPTKPSKTRVVKAPSGKPSAHHAAAEVYGLGDAKKPASKPESKKPVESSESKKSPTQAEAEPEECEKEY